MIYVVTIHHETDKFLDLQRAYYERYTCGDYKIYAGLSNANNDFYMNAKKEGKYPNFHFIDLNDVMNQHWFRMNYLAHEIIKDNPDFDDDDMLVFTDGDAFPVYPWEEHISAALGQDPVKVVAIDRRENPEPGLANQFKPYPHPCFFATKLKFWVDNKLQWSIHPQVPTAGPILKLWLEQHGYAYAAMVRSNVYDLHPLYFAIYGGLIYHHGAGNREVYDSIDIWPRVGLDPNFDLDLRYPNILKFNKQLSDLVFSEIIHDDNFINVYLMGRKP